MVLGALAALLEIEGDISVIAQAKNGKEALDAVLANKPDVFITDIEMPHMTGLDVAAELKRLRTGTRVIIVTTFARTGYLRRALEAGAAGYLLKDMRAEELADAVRRVHQGLRVIHPELATEAWGDVDPLTDRERQVLRLAGEGMASGDIAGELGLSDGTVRNSFLRPSASWAQAIVWRRPELHVPRDGCRAGSAPGEHPHGKKSGEYCGKGKSGGEHNPSSREPQLAEMRQLRKDVYNISGAIGNVSQYGQQEENQN